MVFLLFFANDADLLGRPPNYYLLLPLCRWPLHSPG
jgi:hypothetical protein